MLCAGEHMIQYRQRRTFISNAPNYYTLFGSIEVRIRITIIIIIKLFIFIRILSIKMFHRIKLSPNLRRESHWPYVPLSWSISLDSDRIDSYNVVRQRQFLYSG